MMTATTTNNRLQNEMVVAALSESEYGRSAKQAEIKINNKA